MQMLFAYLHLYLRQFTQLQKKLILAGIVVQLIAIWFSEGYHQADEHWQILELANYKLNIFTPQSLTWEFNHRIRSTFLPFIVYSIRKTLFFVHITNPFVTT